MDRRASRSTRTKRVWAGRAGRTTVVAMAALAMIAGPATPAGADTYSNNFFPAHWGPNQYMSVPPTNPYYRSLVLVDNTADPALSTHIQTFAEIVNYLHFAYNPNYPVILYVKDYHFAAGQPCALGPPQYLIVCKEEFAGTAPGQAAVYDTPAPTNHIFYAVARFRPSVVDPMCVGDKFSIAVQILSNTLGLDYNTSNTESIMYPTFPLGRCTYASWSVADFDRMNQMYSHAAG